MAAVVECAGEAASKPSPVLVLVGPNDRCGVKAYGSCWPKSSRRFCQKRSYSYGSQIHGCVSRSAQCWHIGVAWWLLRWHGWHLQPWSFFSSECCLKGHLHTKWMSQSDWSRDLVSFPWRAIWRGVATHGQNRLKSRTVKKFRFFLAFFSLLALFLFYVKFWGV